MGQPDEADYHAEGDLREDRRTRRTRQLLGRALIELMLEKRYDAITVQDVIDRADVGRSTFYAHYRDKEDLFTREFEGLLAELMHEIEPAGPGDGALVPSLGLFRHVREHLHLYRALVRGRGLEVIQKAGQEYLASSVERRLAGLATGRGESPVPGPVLATFLAGSLLTLLKWWLDSDLPYTAEEMDDFYQRLVTPGIRAALNPDRHGTTVADAARQSQPSRPAAGRARSGSERKAERLPGSA